ncbi:MAG: gamma-glutamyl-gamma-aminobutyrate hydrolase family protein [Candidatus Adiutrix sp.]|jgi:putative glutamine amidotransferase|nr:gamma-glutamyl-gamma-aminobutyrate hydrolase family protein [Candidatus Adiutrix sp.]
MPKPLIGLSAANIPTGDWGESKLQLDRDGQGRLYSEAVALAGGLPLILPLIRTPLSDQEDERSACGPGNLYDNARVYMEQLDGLLLAGGGDLGPPNGAPNPDHYRLVDRSRDIWEAALLAAALELDKPVLGICRGLQLINSALGGSLWTDLPSLRPGPVEHAQRLPRARATHSVSIEAGSKLADILNFSEIMVNSGHHQGVKDLAPPLKIGARAADGLPEALEHREARFVVGVQWHPEGQLAEFHSRALFAAFIMAAEA